MKEIVSALIEISVYSAVVAGTILLFRSLFRKSISPRLQFFIWMLLILRLMLPVTFESGFHVESLLPEPAWEAPVTASPGATNSIPVAVVPEHGGQAGGAAMPHAPQKDIPAAIQAKTDWYAIGFAAWLCGMVAFALWMGFVKLRYYRRMRAARMETPEAVTALYEECCCELGIKRAMPVWVVDAAMSPGIALFGGPVLLMPTSMLSSKEALRFALLHELTHLKRGDHILCAAMNLLRAVYWFHPVIHFALSQMQCDMETACDFDVMRRLHADEKRGYLTTVINLFSFETQPQLGMAQSRTRRMAERRMKGAFMKSAASIGSRIAAAFLAMILLIACFTTACQKAPAGTVTLERTGEDIDGGSPAAPQQPEAAATPGIPAAPPDGQALRGSYDVRAYASDSLTANFRRAAELINAGNGIVVQPGEEWSFNEFFGRRTQSNGWILDPGADRLVSDDIDCISTALYCALLRAGVTVTDRKAHSAPSGYVEKGLDAAVDSSGVDLQFLNNTSALLAIKCALEEDESAFDTIHAEVWGEPLPGGMSYTLRSNVVETFTRSEVKYTDDPTLPEGMRRLKAPGRDGYRVEVYRDTMQAGKLVSSELLYTDLYRGNDQEWIRGTKTPYLLTDMTRSELKALAKLLRAKYLYNSTAHTFDENNRHYAKLFDELEIDFGGAMGGGDAEGMSFTIGVPMKNFERLKCYPYAAVLCALDPGVTFMDLGNMDYDQTPENVLSVTRADVEKHYAAVLDSPLTSYTQSDTLMEEFLIAVTSYEN